MLIPAFHNAKISKNIIIKSMIESSVVKEVFLPTEGVAFAADISIPSRIPSVLAFVRAVQEIGERHGFLKAWLRKFSSEVYQNTI